DWFFALLFQPDIVKISLDSEAALLLDELEEGGARTGVGASHDEDGGFRGAQEGRLGEKGRKGAPRPRGWVMLPGVWTTVRVRVGAGMHAAAGIKSGKFGTAIGLLVERGGAFPTRHARTLIVNADPKWPACAAPR